MSDIPAIQARRSGDSFMAVKHTMLRFKNLVDLTVEKVNIRYAYTARQLDMQTSYIENLVSDIREKVGQREPSLVTKEQINRGSYYDKTKILRPDEYDYEPILDFSEHISNVTDLIEDESMPSLKDQGYKTIRFQEKKLHKGVRQQHLIRRPTPPNGDVELKCRELLAKIRQVVNRVLEEMQRDGSGRVTFIGECDHTKDAPYDYKKRQISTHNEPHGPSVWLRVGAPLGTTDIDMCFCLQWKPHKLGPSVMVPTKKGWLESVVSLPDNSRYTLTPAHEKLLLTFKYVTHLTSLLMPSRFSWSVSSYTLKAVILHHQRYLQGGCHTDNIGKCFMSIIDIMLKPNEEFDNEENVVHLTNQHISIPDIVYTKKDLQISNVKRVSMLVSMFWIAQHVKLNRNTDWFEVFVRNDKDEIKKHPTLKSLDDSLKRFHKIAGKGKVELEWQHDTSKTRVTIMGEDFKEDTSTSGSNGVIPPRPDTDIGHDTKPPCRSSDTSDQSTQGAAPKTVNSRMKKSDEYMYGSIPTTQDQADMPEPRSLGPQAQSVEATLPAEQGASYQPETPSKTCSKYNPSGKTKKQEKCEPTYGKKEESNKHVRKPTEERKYECAKCMNAFDLKSTLSNHEKICQRTDKPFKCTVCKKSFKAERYLKEHIKGHENPDQYKCDICGDTFPYRPTLHSHKRSKHKNQ
ncbi:unnamed protein product [Owenia fusiformis]|uniref:C2H2-type domain-containing protein n=1 Tax=Owenia fusiformis TaxID=6347 RepID=A0A8S4PUW2_OWEFU|nr:unnamed protein product [Owenia fusiformis]